MTELVHDAAGERYYETGVSKGILFPHAGGAYVWNGLTGVDIESQGGEPEKYYFDGVAYFERIMAEEFSATIQCVNTPKAFGPCEGVYETTPGMYTHFNKRLKFNLVWVTKIGNDLNENLGYKLHIIYNAQAQPAARSYQTVTDVATPENRSITVTTTPACGIWSYYSFDSREADVDALLSQILLGTLPSCDQLWVGPPPPPSEEDECVNIYTTFQEYNPGQSLDEDIEDDELETEVQIKGVINNGLDIVEFAILGDEIEDNDSPATPTVVGTGDVLSDADDATYITSGEGDIGYTIPIPELNGGYSPGSVIQLHIRMSIDGGINPEDPDNLDAEAQVHISTDAEGLLTVGGFSDGAQEGMAFKLTNVDGEIVDYIVPLDMDAWINSDINDVVDALRAGAFLNVLGASNFNSDASLLPVEVRVYEAKIVILNGTDSDRYLRAYPESDEGWIFKRVWNPSHTDYEEGAFTATVDFKIKKIQFDSSAIGDEKRPISFDGDIPGSLQLELESPSNQPMLSWRDEGSIFDPDVTVPIEYETWYTVRVYWTDGAANIKVWER